MDGWQGAEGGYMTLDLRWVTIIGLAFDIVGVALVAWPLGQPGEGLQDRRGSPHTSQGVNLRQNRCCSVDAWIHASDCRELAAVAVWLGGSRLVSLAVPAWYYGVEHPERSRSFHEGRRGEMDRSLLRATTLCRLGMSAW